MKRELAGIMKCRDAEVRYYLLAECSDRGAEYGVGAEQDGETLDLRALTSSRTRARTLLESLIRGQVTPVTLRDVVDDWLLA